MVGLIQKLVSFVLFVYRCYLFVRRFWYVFLGVLVAYYFMK